jgi:hypothetical protein
MSFDEEIFDQEIFDVALQPELKPWGYVIPFKLQRRFFATGRISRPQTLVLHGQGVVVKLTKQSVHATGQTRLVAKAHMQGRVLRRQCLTRKVVGKKSFRLVLEALGLLELTYSFMYVAVVDDRTCDLCLQHDKHVMSGEDAERTFPYLMKEPGDSVWFPNTHVNCRCMLVLRGWNINE